MRKAQEELSEFEPKAKVLKVDKVEGATATNDISLNFDNNSLVGSTQAPTQAPTLSSEPLQKQPQEMSAPLKNSSSSSSSSSSSAIPHHHLRQHIDDYSSQESRTQVMGASSDPNYYKNACGYSAAENHELEVW
jgi:hypothetical protein